MISSIATRLRVLVVGRRVLHPLQSSSRVRLFHLLRALRQNHEITYLAFRLRDDDNSAVAAATEYAQEPICVTHAVRDVRHFRFASEVAFNAFVGRHPYVAAKSFSWPMQKRLKSLLSERTFDLIICTELAAMVNLIELHEPPPAPILLLHPQIESLEWKRRAEAESGRLRTAALRRQHQRIEHLETICAQMVRAQVTVAPQDTDYLRHVRGMSNVLGDIPGAVDAAEFQLRSAPPEPGVLAFAGAMNLRADCDAVEWFAADIFPLIRRQFPSAQFFIIGPDPPSRIAALAEKDRGISVTGAVTDLRPLMAGATALVVPIRAGSGGRLEPLEALAMGVPVVSTTAGAAGLPRGAGEFVLTADAAETFAAHCLKLLTSPEITERIASAGRDFVEQHARWSESAAIFETFCLETAQNRLPRI